MALSGVGEQFVSRQGTRGETAKAEKPPTEIYSSFGYGTVYMTGDNTDSIQVTYSVRKLVSFFFDAIMTIICNDRHTLERSFSKVEGGASLSNIISALMKNDLESVKDRQHPNQAINASVFCAENNISPLDFSY